LNSRPGWNNKNLSGSRPRDWARSSRCDAAYFDDFERAVELGDVEEARGTMLERYPDYRPERLLREYSLPAYLASGRRP
jgi:hypothetical protein